MIYTALCIMFWMRAYPLLGQVGVRWALEFSSLLGFKWHWPICSMPFHRAQKTREFQGPTPSHLPSSWICTATHPKHYVQGCINHRCINSYIICVCPRTSLVEAGPRRLYRPAPPAGTIRQEATFSGNFYREWV
jgi:hypothetical protein